MGFSIAQVTPWPWEQHHEVNRFVERLSDELCQRGHRVVVVTPSDSRELVREGRATVKRLRTDPEAVFDAPGCASMLAVGQSLPFRRGGSVSVPLDVSRTLEELLDRTEFDFVHVHEPFAPSAASAALRHSRALNVGTFHSATERFVSTQVGRKVVELLFGRLDGRTATFAATRDMIERYFPGEYRVIRPGADLLQRPRANGGPPEIVFSAEEERGALRLFLRALRRLPTGLDWRATIWLRDPATAPAVNLSRRLRERVRLAGPADGSEAQHLARADIAVAASAGTAPAPQLVLRALAGGAVPVVSRLPQYEEALRDGELGLLFEPRDAITLAAQLERLVAEPRLVEDFAGRIGAAHPDLEWSRVAEEFESLFDEIAGRRHGNGRVHVQRRLAKRDYIHVDLHMHTDHSPDCATPVGDLLDTAKRVGLGAIAITDHNEISGALEARERADGIKVIVAEEVKTADQGEVIGLFIEDKIARGMTLQETIAEIRRQGGLVYVPHPFDRLHSIPDAPTLHRHLAEIDVLEVYNARLLFEGYNDEAVRFARKYGLPAGAGSDAHVLQGVGTGALRMRAFEGPEEFLLSVRTAEVLRRPKSLAYLQSLKWVAQVKEKVR